MYKIDFDSYVENSHRKTTAFIYSEDKLIAKESVKCHFKDHDCKVLGQKAAITKAIKSISDYGKIDREAMWDKFFNHSNATFRLR